MSDLQARAESLQGEEAAQDAAPSITCIPDDILYHIFSLIATDAFVSEDLNLGNVGCVPISHVCRHWRFLSLNSPKLWSFLHLSTQSRVSMLSELLARSGQTLLSIRMRGPRTVWELTHDLARMAHILSGYTDRFVAFSLSGFLPEVMEQILAPLASPAPQLRALDIHSGDRMFHPAPFLGWMPMLRHVSITALSMPWIPYRDMVELELLNQIAPPLEQLWWTLQNSPSIELLSIMLIRPTVSDSVIDAPELPIVRLSKLRQLDLGSTLASNFLLQLLARLSFPLTTSVHLRFLGRTYEHMDLCQHCPPLGEIVRQVHQCFLQFLTSHNSHSVILKSADGHISLDWQWAADYVDTSLLRHVAFATASFPVVQSLVVQAYAFDQGREEWSNVLERVPTIEVLEVDFRLVSTRTVLGFFDALSRTAEDGQVVCPKLRRLVILRLADIDRDTWSEVVAFLFVRARLGAHNLDLLEIMLEKNVSDSLRILLEQLESVVGSLRIYQSRRRQGLLR